MKINVYGSTLTAWVAAACLAKVGNDVYLQLASGTGKDRGALKALGDISAIRDEPGLKEEITQQIEAGRLNRLKRIELSEVDVHWFAFEPNEHQQAEVIVDELGLRGKADSLVVNQANFGVGATAALQNRVEASAVSIECAYVPDNIEQGRALRGFLELKRLIIGGDSQSALKHAKGVLRPFSKSLASLQEMGTKEAEFTKFATTGMLAIRLGYINELANLADKLEVDIDVIRDGMAADPRIGYHYLSPGCGFGGQTFHAYIAKLSDIFKEQGSQSLLNMVLEENEVQKELLFRKLWEYYKADLTGKKITIWGGAFKPGTASIDSAPSLKIIEALLSQGVSVHIYDPEALANLRAYFGASANVYYYNDMYQAAESSDGLLLVTEWMQFQAPDFSKLHKIMRKALIIDGRNLFDKEIIEKFSFDYIGVGR